MQTLLLILLGLLLLFLIFVSYVIASFGMTAFFGAPFVATKRGMIHQAFERAGLRTGQSVGDIGCGDGGILCVARDVGATRLIGYELNPLLVLAARWRLRGADAVIRRGNMFRASIEPVDMVFLYLFPKAVERLKPQLKALPPQTKILSRGFPFKNVVPMRSFEIDGSHFYLYLARDLGAQP